MTKTIGPTFSDATDSRRAHLRQIPGEMSSQTVGKDLRAARLRRGDDIATVSRVLRIRKDHLEAIEEDRLDDLPGRTYAVGFVRSYVEYLGLDPAEYMERFKTEIAGRTEHAPLAGLPPHTGSDGLPYGWTLMALIVIGVVAYGGYHLVRSAEIPAMQTVAPVPAAIAPSPAQHRPAQTRHVQASPAATLGSAPTNVPHTATNAPAPSSAAPAAGKPDANPQQTPLQTAPSAPSAATNAALVGLPAGQVFGQQNKNVRLVLRVRAATHVLVEGPGGKVYINRVLQPGDVYRVPDLVGLSLTTPDGGAVFFELDGQDMGAAGRSGQMTEALSLDPQAIVDRAAGGNPGRG